MIKLSNGKSDKDRISFYTSDNCATAIRHPNGEITIEFEKENVYAREVIRAIFRIFGIPLIIKAFVILPLIESNKIGIVWYLIPTFLYVIYANREIINLRKSGGIECLRNHGAEHKVYAAYNSLKRIPTVEETKRFSRISRLCGVTIYSAFITTQLIGFIVYVQKGFIIPEIILFIIPIFCHPFFPFNFLGKIAQFFTTSEPEKSNIELAIAALSALERKEILLNSLTDIIREILKN